jgi:heavy metal sensor kinase
MKRLSIGLRLTLWYVLIFTTAQVIFGTVMWLSLRHHLYDIADDALHDEMDDLTTFLQAQKKDASFEKLQEEVTEEYRDEHAGEFLELYDEHQNLIFRSDKLNAAAAAFSWPELTGEELTVDRKLHGKPMRFLVKQIRLHDHVFLARLGIPVQEIHETLEAFRRYLLMLAPLLLLAAAGGGYWLSRRALAPVDQLTRAARQITGTSLGSRLEHSHTGDELQRLADTLNEMLDRIEVAFRRVTEFTADASHELRTPVALIRTEAELALRRSRNSEEYRAALEHILGEAERTTRLLEQLLALARTDAGREFLEARDLNLGDLMEQSAQAWSGVANAKELRFVRDLSPAAVTVKGDEAALRRVIDILMDNAVKYSHERGVIRLGLHAESDAAVITVQDDGIGIAADEQEKIFERFYRVDKARSRQMGGAGLGLSIAQWIVQKHGGMIAVRSEAGTGSTFEVRIPLSAAQRGAGAQGERAASAVTS